MSVTSSTCSGGQACPVRCVRPSCWICRSALQLSSSVMCSRGRAASPGLGCGACSETPVEAASEMTATSAAPLWNLTRAALRCAATSARPLSSTAGTCCRCSSCMIASSGLAGRLSASARSSHPRASSSAPASAGSGSPLLEKCGKRTDVITARKIAAGAGGRPS
eukprot:scaffold113256_cov57-Phaeocystis_antarctica.AAC.1